MSVWPLICVLESSLQLLSCAGAGLRVRVASWLEMLAVGVGANMQLSRNASAILDEP